jgi:hypothetical protein
MDGKIADDRLRGVKAIAEETGETERQCATGLIWVGSQPLRKAAFGVLHVGCCANNIAPKCGPRRSNGAVKHDRI